MNELRSTNPRPTCAQFCGLHPTITGGSASVCNGANTTFSISNNSGLPATWAVSPNLTVVSQNTTSITVRASSSTISASGWIDAIVRNNTGCEVNATRRNIWVGRPGIPSNIAIEADRDLCANQVAEFYVVNSNSSITNYVWGFYGASILSGQGSSRVATRINNTSSVSVDLELGNACGNTTSAVTADFDVNCNNLTILIYPNPADEQLTIELVNVPVENTDSIPELKITNQDGILINASQPTEEFSIILYNADQQEVATAVSENSSIHLDTSPLSAGTYFLHIYYQGDVSRQQVLIE